jgi:Tfp pilus assembly protein PilF
LDELASRLKTTPFAPGDQTVLYNVKEMAINGSLCLSREQVNGLFAAALANPTASAYVRSILLSWHADYLWLSAKDMAAARDALAQSLAINPASPSNRLKWAQLLFISGERLTAAALLRELRNENLSAEEQITLDELLQAPGMRP